MGAKYDGLKNLSRRLRDADIDRFIDECTYELAGRLLSLLRKNTLPGQYSPSSGKMGGTLRRGWTGGRNENPTAYARSLPIHRRGNNVEITIINPVEYASYVEYGHRTRGGKGWVAGKFIMTDAEQKIQQMSRARLERMLKDFLEGVMKP